MRDVYSRITSKKSPSFCITTFSASLTNLTVLLPQSHDYNYYHLRYLSFPDLTYISLIRGNSVTTQNLWFFRRDLLKVLRCYNFILCLQRRHNCSPAASYDTIPVKSAPANVSFYTNNSKNAKFWVVTLLSQMSDICLNRRTSIDLLEVFQVLPACPSDKSSISSSLK